MTELLNSVNVYKSFIEKDQFCFISNLSEENIFKYNDRENLRGSKMDFYNIYQQKIDHYNNKYIKQSDIMSNITLISDSIFTLFDINCSIGAGENPTYPYFKRVFSILKTMNTKYYNGTINYYKQKLVNLVNLYPIIKDNIPFEIYNISGVYDDGYHTQSSNYVYFGLYISNDFGFSSDNSPNMLCNNAFALSYIDVDFTFIRATMDIGKFSLCANALAHQSLSSISSYTYTYYSGGDSISGILRLNVGSTILESINYQSNQAACIPESNNYVSDNCKIIYELLTGYNDGGDIGIYFGNINRTRLFYPQHFVLYNMLKGLNYNTNSYLNGTEYLYSNALSMRFDYNNTSNNNLFYLDAGDNNTNLSYIYINELYYHFLHNNKYYILDAWTAYGENHDIDEFEFISPKPNVTNINIAGCDINSYTYVLTSNSVIQNTTFLNKVPIRTNLNNIDTSSSVDEGAGLSIIGLVGYDVNPIYKNEYFTLNIYETASGTNYIGFSNAALMYSKNGGAWTNLPAYDANNKATTGIVVNAGDIIRFKNNGQTLNTTTTFNNQTIPNLGTFKSYPTNNASFKIVAYGNLTSLTTQDFINAPTLNGKTLARLFESFKPLIIAEGLYMPDTDISLPDYCYLYMFSNCSNLYSGLLHISKVSAYACTYMFNNCTSLYITPRLSSTTLYTYCYKSMFQGCTTLTTFSQKILPATTLASYCYYQMFKGCTTLTIAPVLPATYLVSNCYYQMFNGCSTLKYIKCLATNISASNCTNSWVTGVSSSGTFVKNTATIWTTGTAGIPSGWTTINVPNVENEPPTNLTYPDDLYVNYDGAEANNSYYYNPANPNNYFAFEAIEPTTFKFTRSKLYYSLDNGNTWTELPANTNTPLLDSGDLILWFGYNLTPNSTLGIGTFSSTGKFKVFGSIMSLHFGSNTTSGADIISLSSKNRAFRKLFNSCTNLIYADGLQLPATTLSQYCYAEMFYGCTNLLSAPQILPASALVANCYREMFYGCSKLVQAPNLPALSLQKYCYYQMFYNCSQLNYIECFATTISATGSHTNWVSGVASSGTFVKNPSMTDWPVGGASGIPSGWVIVDYPG